MRIAIIGAGNVGGGLGAAFTRAGHEVVFGVRDPDSDKSRAAISAAPGSRAAAPTRCRGRCRRRRLRAPLGGRAGHRQPAAAARQDGSSSMP